MKKDLFHYCPVKVDKSLIELIEIQSMLSITIIIIYNSGRTFSKVGRTFFEIW